MSEWEEDLEEEEEDDYWEEDYEEEEEDEEEDDDYEDDDYEDEEDELDSSAIARSILKAFAEDPSGVVDVIRINNWLTPKEINEILNPEDGGDDWFSKEMRKLS